MHMPHRRFCRFRPSSRTTARPPARGCRRLASWVFAGFFGIAVSAGAASSPTIEQSSRWQGFRGALDAPSGVLPDDIGLEVLWQRPLGAGYSSPALADGRVLVSFTAEEHDVVVALDLATGEELWRHTLAPVYRGHDGSEDGPLASPAVDGDRVYQLGPRGQLVALSLADGAMIWQAQLDEENSTEPEYGYTSSPVVVGDSIVVMTGGEQGAVAAYDRGDGTRLWSAGSDSVNYQTPVVAELLGRRQILATTNYWLYGVDLETGEELWRHKVSESMNESAHATPVSDSKVVVNLYGSSVALEFSKSGDTWTVSEAWKGPIFGKTYAVPVLHDDHLYGFTGRILTCADPATGDIVWRSRDLKALHLTLVDGHLLALDLEGHVVLAAASPEAYEEKVRLAVFEQGDYAAPAFADGHIVVRNQSEIAALRVLEAPTAEAPVVDGADEEGIEPAPGVATGLAHR